MTFEDNDYFDAVTLVKLSEPVDPAEQEQEQEQVKPTLNVPINRDTFIQVYPFNLMQEVLMPADVGRDASGTVTDEYFENVLSLNILSFLTRMNKHLTERELAVVRMRWEQGLTLREIGDSFNVTPERVRQIGVKALRKLRDVCRFGGVMTVAPAYTVQAQASEIAHLRGLLSRITKVANKEFAGWSRASHLSKYTPIEAVDFSVRTFGCLKRANLNTLCDVVDCIESKGLGGIRNLGLNSALEVGAKLEKYLGLRYSRDELMQGVVDADV